MHQTVHRVPLPAQGIILLSFANMKYFLTFKLSNTMGLPTNILSAPQVQQHPQAWMAQSNGNASELVNRGPTPQTAHLGPQVQQPMPQTSQQPLQGPTINAQHQPRPGVLSAQQRQLAAQILLQRNAQPPQVNIQAGPGQMRLLPQQLESSAGQDGVRELATIPPPEKDKFEPSLKSFWMRHNIQFDPQVLQVGNRRISLHDLHSEVSRLGGGAAVSIL